MPTAKLREEWEIGRRVSPRTRCSVVVDISDGAAGWVRALLSDFSNTGFRLDRVRGPVAGSSLWLRPDGMQPIAAKIRWINEGAIGCQFLFPLSEQAEADLRQCVAGDGPGDAPAHARPKVAAVAAVADL
jgi:hypothetical protein